MNASTSGPIERVGFIGTGIMGSSMAGHLLAAGHELHVHSRTRSKAASLLDRGGHWHDSPAEVVAASDVVITMLGMPSDVAAVYFGDEASANRGEPQAASLLGAARPGTLLVDMTTSSPALAASIAAAADARGLAAIDAPVSGGDVGARTATLVVMVGGDADPVARARPLLARLAKSVTHLGPAGAGQRCKLANQVAVAVGMVAWCEALAHARAGGLDPAAVQRVIEGGAAGSWALTNLAPRALAGDFAPGFLVKHLIKDLRLARECAEESGIELPGLETAERLYERAASLGWSDEGTQSLLKLFIPAPEKPRDR